MDPEEEEEDKERTFFCCWLLHLPREKDRCVDDDVREEYEVNRSKHEISIAIEHRRSLSKSMDVLR